MLVSELRSGDKLGRYEVIRPLARGGMAELFLARQSGAAGFEKVVVLKRILPHVARDRALVSMFIDEARLSATLHHPNIVEVFDIGNDGRDYFFAMEYVHGQDARAIRYAAQAALQPIPLPIALAIVLGVASALEYAHARADANGPLGVVHRDVTPSNILVSYDGAIKLVDFGIARAASRKTRTPSGVLRGNIHYMSPEQCRSKALDRRSDLFSLGIVLYELTCGVRPFIGRSDFSVLEAITSASVRRPSALVPGYPLPLEMVVMRLLERDLDRRYQTADDLVGHLETFIRSQDLFVSSHQMARYMRELFPTEPAAASVADEVTRADVVAPFDPVETFRTELLAGLDADVPRRIDRLIERAVASRTTGELDKAVAAVELAMIESERSHAARDRMRAHRPAVQAIFAAFIGWNDQVPVLVRPLQELVAEPTVTRWMPLLVHVDGRASIDELARTTGLSELAIHRSLCALMLRRVVILDSWQMSDDDVTAS